MLTAARIAVSTDVPKAFDFEDALRLVWPRAVRTAYGLLGDMQTAQDVVQDACLIAHGKRANLRDENAFESWFLTIAVRRAYAVSKRAKRTSAIDARDVNDPDVAALVDVRRAVDALAPKLRAAVVLCDVLSHTSEEAAALLGVPAATIRNRIFRARRALAVTLADYAPQKRDRS